jgi:hypothetical protein
MGCPAKDSVLPVAESASTAAGTFVGKATSHVTGSCPPFIERHTGAFA